MDYNGHPTIDSVDRRRIMESYFPEFIRGNKDFRVFIKLATEELGLISDYIELFTDLADIDTTPEQFIEDLGEMVGYSYIDNVDPDVQREIIKRIFNKHEARGDEKSLTMMAENSQNLGYLGGDLFVPGTYLQGQEAVLTFPRDILYTWNKSKRSGFDKYPDGVIAVDGVIEILIGYYDENIRRRTESVKPAGVKIYFKMSIAMTGENAVVKIPLPKIYTDMCLDISKYISCHRITEGRFNAWSGASPYITRSGRVRQEFKIGPEIAITASSRHAMETIKDVYYPQYDMEDIMAQSLAIPMQILKQWRGCPTYSDRFVWDGKYGRSGIRTGEIPMYAPYRKMPDLRNPTLTLSQMDNVHTDGSDHIRQSPVEIEIKQGHPEIHLVVRGQRLKDSIIPETYPGETLDDIINKDLVVPVEVSIKYHGLPKWSSSTEHSGRYSRSGSKVDIEESKIKGVPKWSVDFTMSGVRARSGQEDL